MPGPLKNARHERFAQELAKGTTHGEAYAAAGYKRDDKNAARLTKNDGVAARIAELKERAAEKTIITADEIAQRLLKIAEKGEAGTDAPLLSVGRAALMDVAKLRGHIVDRTKVGLDLNGATEEELEILERLFARSAPGA